MDILIVDDEVVMRSLVALAIQRKGHSVTVAATPVQALEYLANTTPDMIILDVMMPHIDGITFCRRLRSHPATESTPIIIFSAVGDERTRKNALAAGATYYCHKLNMHDDLYGLIQECLQNQRPGQQPLTNSEAIAAQAGQSKSH